jgi:glycosyltransferase involved in cell wall biosynthesis
MKFVVITHVLHKLHNKQIWGYGPYIREMNIWENHTDSLIVVAPAVKDHPSEIDLPYQSEVLRFLPVPVFNVVGFKSIVVSLTRMPKIMATIYIAMKEADHIHIRCPGNMGVLGVIVQLLFPKKKKTAKYAGNWDWNSRQPFSYRFQQSILSNPLLSRNMQVMVYGDWNRTSKNVKAFFTASYSESEKIDFTKPPMKEGVNLIFVGSLTKNKRPLLALEVLQDLVNQGTKARLVFCGDGIERSELIRMSELYKLDDRVRFLGNVNADRVKEELINSHFLLFGSRSEGWPKVVAEAMWWGCIPVTTSVSCVPQMLAQGARGHLCEPNRDEMARKVLWTISMPDKQREMIRNGIEWSRNYTIEKFESEIKKLLQP